MTTCVFHSVWKRWKRQQHFMETDKLVLTSMETECVPVHLDSLIDLFGRQQIKPTSLQSFIIFIEDFKFQESLLMTTFHIKRPLNREGNWESGPWFDYKVTITYFLSDVTSWGYFSMAEGNKTNLIYNFVVEIWSEKILLHFIDKLKANL